MNRIVLYRTLSLLALVASTVIVFVIGCSTGQSPDSSAARLHPSQTGGYTAGAGNLFTGAPGSLRHQGEPAAPLASEELWVIAKPDSTLARADTERDRAHQSAEAQRVQDSRPAVGQAGADHPRTSVIPGSGALMTTLPGSDAPVPVPLKHTDVKANIAGYIATVDVSQQYHNPYDAKIEAVYVFPLPANAAVNEFLMTIGQRRIRGIIRERAEAERISQAARSQGHVASLLTQERPNVFTQSVANIEPGKAIDIHIKYFHTLGYIDGWYEYVFPMVVGPRFNPPGYTDGIGAIGHGTPAGATGQKTEVPYLRPEQRSGHDISLAVHLDAGVEVEQIDSRNHKVALEKPEPGLATVRLDAADTIPNKDFVLRYKVAGDRVKSAIICQRDGKGAGGYFTLMLYPPETLKHLPRKPLELFFTLDVSGSMSGQPIEQSRAAIRYALQHMRPDDTFQVIRFAGAAEQMSSTPLPATPRNVAHGLQYIQQMSAGGGTMMLEGIKASLHYPHDEARLRFVAFLTDGYIGNEPEILREVNSTRGPSRVFSFGVGSSPNRYLLDHMAKLGAGCAAYVGLNDDAAKVMAGFFERISHPALTDLSIDWGGMQVTEVYPQKLPDLFVGRPVVLTGRFTGRGEATVRVTGKVGGQTRHIELPVNLDQAPTHRGVASVWARTKIADLADRATWEPRNDLPAEIRQVALEHGLMSAYTAFVAVDSLTRTAGDHGTTVAVPVPVPDGVRYDTTVPE